jgi:hypothetical protein
MHFPFFSSYSKKQHVAEKSAKDDYFLGSSEHFGWRAQAGRGSIGNVDWITRDGISYLERVYFVYKNSILQLGDAKRLPIQVTVKPSVECKHGIGGATGSGELSYCAGTWASNGFCYGVLAHELCNLFTGERVSSGWPTEWWANHRSPFPTMIANQAIQRIVPEYYRKWGDYHDSLVVMFERLYNDYPSMFPKMFQKMRQLGVSLSRYQEPYLSHVVYYFMFYGAGSKEIANLFVRPMPPINPRALSEIESSYNLRIV